MIDDVVLDDTVAVKDSTQPGSFAIGKVIHVNFETDEISFHYWGSPCMNVLTAALEPEYF